MVAFTGSHLESLTISFRDIVKNKGFSSVIFGLSGDIDSVVVALLCKKAGLDLLAIIMPSSVSSESSLIDSIMLCDSFDVGYQIVKLYDFEDVFNKSVDICTLLQKGNFCASMRTIMLYRISSIRNALVIGTTNKSKLLLGYCTIHGDLAHAINPIGPFFKTQIYDTARVLEILQAIVDKSLVQIFMKDKVMRQIFGYSYAYIDRFLESYLACKGDIQRLTQYPKDMVIALDERIRQNSFKRSLPHIVEISL